jgi:NAD(P)-dependent dehydrogenase (short-subunit alcohol dehydrogenase family)
MTITPLELRDPAQLLRLDGKRTLIAGGYGGLGTSIAELFAACGASVAIGGRSAAKAASLADQISQSTGQPALGCELDITSPASIAEAIGGVASAWSGVDILINCASKLITASAENFDEDSWRSVLDANLTGAFWLSQEVGKQMIAAGGGGRIIHLSSVRSAAGARRGFTAYGASKAGLNLLVKQLATEWGRHGITVNAVAPGFVRTEFVQQSAEDPAFVKQMLGRIPLGRLAEPEEVASAVLYLASEPARFITGQILFVDGGVTASQ